MALSHNTLENYFSTMFSLIQHHKYSISEIENLIPFEKDLYVTMLLNYLSEIEEEKQRQRA